MAKKNKAEPTLVAYWDKLTKADIALLNYAVVKAEERDNPGALIFLKVQQACNCILYAINNAPPDAKKGPFYRLLHKLESWKHVDPLDRLSGGRGQIFSQISTERMAKLMPHRLRQPVKNNPYIFNFALPFAKGKDRWLTVTATADPNSNFWRFNVNLKYYMATKAWLDGVTIKAGQRPKRPKTRR